MKGLILKDLYIMRDQMKIVLIILLVYFILPFISEEYMTFPALAVIICGIMPVATMSFDRQSSWDAYAAAMPIQKSSMVWSKYILGILLLAAAAIPNVLIEIPLSTKYHVNLSENIQIICIAAMVAVIYQSIMMFLSFLLNDPEKARILFFILTFGGAALVGLISKQPWFRLNQDMHFWLLIFGITAVLLFVVSGFASAKIYEKRDR
ncbi:MAG: ABC-2 transporter permease [Clostridia bacterium]|nr:ABC-2 transporter permease [Clostridia bacterium]NCC43863.1 ABC-2 transporter permease [Clostridia bacterium]